MSAEESPDPGYLARRYPDPALRACMATDAGAIAARAYNLGNPRTAETWSGLARRLRDSLREVSDAR